MKKPEIPYKPNAPSMAKTARQLITVDMAIKMFDAKPEPLTAYTLMLVARAQWAAGNLMNPEFNEVLVTLESYLDHLVLKEISMSMPGNRYDP